MAGQPTLLYRAFPKAISLFIILSACAAQSFAQSGGGTNSPNNPGRSVSHNIRGKIFLPSDNLPEQRLRVVVELNTDGIVNEVFSDSMGNFAFRSLPNGTYKIVVQSDGQSYYDRAEKELTRAIELGKREFVCVRQLFVSRHFIIHVSDSGNICRPNNLG
jgi:Carboxypeptidase regulatory-like domain